MGRDCDYPRTVAAFRSRLPTTDRRNLPLESRSEMTVAHFVRFDAKTVAVIVLADDGPQWPPHPPPPVVKMSRTVVVPVKTQSIT